MNKRIFRISVLLLFVFWLSVSDSQAQPTEFTYQGRLLSGTLPANGTHDFEFSLWNADTGGGQIGSTVTLNGVNVNNGVFSVRIDFGSVFTGANRFLEIKVRQSGAGSAFSTLSPRQAITSAPYSIKSINADTAANADTARNAFLFNGLTPNQVVLFNDSRLTDARNPLPNSPNYIQNSTAQQSSTNFNISGNGTVGGTLNGNAVNTATSFNLNGIEILSGSGLYNAQGLRLSNTFVGERVGLNTIPDNNPSNSQGKLNTFVGAGSGRDNNTGFINSFFGTLAGAANTSGFSNAFFGYQSGARMTQGFGNAFFGTYSGLSNTTGVDNAFVGDNAGSGNTLGSQNSFFGSFAGSQNLSGRNNTILGYRANLGANNLVNAAALGANSRVDQNNSMVLGSISGINNAIANTFVGIGTTTPTAKLTVAGGGAYNSSNAARFDLFNTTANLGYLQNVTDDGLWQLATSAGATRIAVDSTGRVGIGTAFPLTRLHVSGNSSVTGDLAVGANALPTATLDVYGTIKFSNFGTTGGVQLCRDGAGRISMCQQSSIRFKQNINSFSPGLNLIKRLRPVSFNWKSDKTSDFGLIAEEVAEVEPLLTFKNEKGETEGVKYDRIGVVLINAVNEQQLEIESQQKQINEQEEIIRQQQAELTALKKLVCSQNPAAELCQPKN